VAGEGPLRNVVIEVHRTEMGFPRMLRAWRPLRLTMQHKVFEIKRQKLGKSRRKPV
jgi:hypothetical protein